MCSTVRAVLSLLPPGAEPTTISTFFCGVHPWAQHKLVASVQTAASAVTEILIRTPRDCLLLRNVRGLDDPGVLVDLGAYEFRERFGRAAHRLQTVIDETLAKLGTFQDPVDFRIPPAHDLSGRFGRRHEAEPGRRFVASQPRLVECGHLR